MGAKLSKVQERAYNKLKKHGGWANAYELRESMATMNALRNKGLVRAIFEKGLPGQARNTEVEVK